MTGARGAGAECAWPYAYSWRHSAMVSTQKCEDSWMTEVQHLHEMWPCHNGEAELRLQIFPYAPGSELARARYLKMAALGSRRPSWEQTRNSLYFRSLNLRQITFNRHCTFSHGSSAAVRAWRLICGKPYGNRELRQHKSKATGILDT